MPYYRSFVSLRFDIVAIATPYTTYFKSFVPIAQQAWQAVVLGHLSLSMCLWMWSCDNCYIEKPWPEQQRLYTYVTSPPPPTPTTERRHKDKLSPSPRSMVTASVPAPASLWDGDQGRSKYTISIILSPKVGRRSCWVAYLLVCVSRCDHVIIGTSKNLGLDSSVCTLGYIPPSHRLKDLTRISYLPLFDLWLQDLYLLQPSPRGGDQSRSRSRRCPSWSPSPGSPSSPWEPPSAQLAYTGIQPLYSYPTFSQIVKDWIIGNGTVNWAYKKKGRTFYTIYKSYTLCIWPDSEPTKLLYHPNRKPRRRVGLRQRHTCRQVLLLVNSLKKPTFRVLWLYRCLVHGL